MICSNRFKATARDAFNDLEVSDKVEDRLLYLHWHLAGPPVQVPVVCFQFRMSHFTCKAYLAHGTQDEGGLVQKKRTPLTAKPNKARTRRSEVAEVKASSL